MPSLSPADARRELDRRWQAAIAGVTPEAIATGKHGERHEIQIEIMRCEAQNLIFMCSRRAGKSEVCCGLLLMTAIKTPDVSCLYLALTSDAAEPIWRKWRKLLKRFNIPNSSSDHTQFTEFPNGSRVYFTGTDDTRRVTHFLGDQLAAGMAVIDEAQDDPGIMEATVENVLGPMLDEATRDKPIPGRLVISGTVPETPHGFYWNTWVANRNADDTATKTAAERALEAESKDEHSDDERLWETFAWSRFQNPFQIDNEKREASYCKKYRRRHDDPSVRRRFHGERVFTKEAKAYRFEAKAHTYAPEVEHKDITPIQTAFHCTFAALPEDCDRFIVGIDQAQRRDRFAIVVWTWSHRKKNNVWHLAECVTDKGADPQESEWLAICAELRTRYSFGSMEFIRDAGGSSAPVNDMLKHSHGILVNSAIKTPGSLKARVQRLADLLAVGVAKVIENSRLADDLTVARWSEKDREKGKWQFDKSAGSPDVADAASYAFDLPSYTQIGAMKPPPKPLTFEEKLALEQKKTLEMVLHGKVPKPPPIPTYVAMWSPPPKDR